MVKNIITADDVIKAGACESGVYEVLEREHKNVSAAMFVTSVLKILKEEEISYAINAAGLDGYGYGSGGYGYGYGSGND